MEGSCRGDDAARSEAAAIDRERAKPGGAALDPRYRRAKHNRQIEVARVLAQVGSHLVAHWVVLSVARKRQTWQRRAACWREQSEALVVARPGAAKISRGLEDRERQPSSAQVVTTRKPGLPAADHQNIVLVDHSLSKNARFFACGGMVLIFLLCAVFPRTERKHCTQIPGQGALPKVER